MSVFPANVFGPVIDGTGVEVAVRDTIDKWFLTYLREFEVQAGLIPDHHATPFHPLPKSFSVANNLDRSNTEALPSIVVVSPGTSDRIGPRMSGDGMFIVNYLIGVGCFVSAPTRADTMKLVRVYTAICRTILLHKQSLGGYASGSTWLDESWDDDFTFTDDQTISVGQAVFEIEVAGVVSRYGGPDEPDGDDTVPGTWPVVEDVIAVIEMKED